MGERRDTRTWRSSGATEPAPVVRDPATRAVLAELLRAKQMEIAALRRALGLDEAEEDPAA